MIDMTRKLAVLTILLLLASIQFVGAAEADANLRAFSNQACPTGSAKYAVDITNPGNAPDTYNVKANVPWSTVAPSTVEVGGGETETAFIWLQPPVDKKPGTYSFDVELKSSNTGETTTVSGTIEVLSCRSVDVNIQEDSQSVCRGDTAEYTVNVQNNGDTQETYDLAANAGSLSTNQVTLAPGESRQVTLSAMSDTEAQETLKVRAESTSSYASDEDSAEFTARQCRSMDLFLSPSQQNVCAGETGEFSVTVQNTGEKQDSYALQTNVDGANVPDISLAPGESQTFEMTVSEAAGTHTIVARAASKTLQDVRRTEDASLTVENCYAFGITSQGNNTLQIGKGNTTLMQFGIRNEGTRSDTYNIEFDGPEWADVKPLETELESGEAAPAYLYVAPDFFAEKGTYSSKMVVTSENSGEQRVVDVTLTVGNETIVADTDGQDNVTEQPGEQPTGDIISRTSGLVAIILVLSALFVGGYWFFRNRWDDGTLESRGGARASSETEESAATEVDQDDVQAAVSGAAAGGATEAAVDSTDAERDRDYYKSADDFLDQNSNTVRRALREDNLSKRYLEVLLEEEKQTKRRTTVINEIQRQLSKKNGE